MRNNASVYLPALEAPNVHLPLEEQVACQGFRGGQGVADTRTQKKPLTV